MALIKCPDCGQPISTNASACPNCGRPSKNHLEQAVFSGTQRSKARNEGGQVIAFVAIIIAIVVGMIAGVSFGAYVQHKK